MSPAPQNYERRYDYDANDDVIRAVIQNIRPDATGQDAPDPDLPEIQTLFGYTSARKVASVRQTITASDVATVSFGYDLEDRLTSVTSAEGNVTEIAYDERDKVLQQTRGAGSASASTTRFSYNPNGDLVTLTDGRGNDRSIEYDVYDRPIAQVDPQVDPQGARTVSTFDPVGNPVHVQAFGFPSSGGGLLSEVFRDYDEANRLIRQRTPIVSATGASGDAIQVFQRDAAGRVVKVLNPNGNPTTFDYDGLDRLVLARDALGHELQRTYDPASNLLESLVQEVIDGSGSTETFRTTFAHDALDRPISARDNRGQTRRMAYDSRSNVVLTSDANGPVTGTTNAPGNTIRQIYDGSGRITRVIQDLREGGTGAGAIVDTIEATYQWDQDDRLTSVTDDNGNTTGYTYDALDRLTRVDYPDGTFESVFYDENGNAVQITQRSGTLVQSVFDANDRLTSRQIQPAPDISGTAFESYAYLYPLFIPSIDSGASHQGYRLYRRTALGATYQEASAQDTTIQVDYNRALSYAQYAGVSVHAVLVLVNDAKYAVSTWANRISIVPDFNQATGPQGTATFEDLLGHEFLGHALGQLWDEYTYGQNKSDPSAWAPNCDRNPQAPKWLALMGWQWVASLWNYIYVGTFPGCTNGQHYRPTRMECRMNLRAHHPFCTVCYHRIAGVLRSF